MKSQKTSRKTESANAGSLPRLVRWLVSRYCPDLIADRADLLRAAKEIGEKLRASREESEDWRQRCFSAENALRAAKRGITMEMEKHDQTHGTTLHWS